MVGIARGQTARLSAVNVEHAGPARCVVLSFVDAFGTPLASPSTVLLGPGQSSFIDLAGDGFFGAIDAATRVEVRAVVKQLPGACEARTAGEPDRFGSILLPVDPCVPSVEVFDTDSGGTVAVQAPVAGVFR